MTSSMRRLGVFTRYLYKSRWLVITIGNTSILTKIISANSEMQQSDVDYGRAHDYIP